MTDLLIQPSHLSGTVEIPPSKSMAHRAVIAAALAEGDSVIGNVQLSDDIIATIEGMRTLGAVIEESPDDIAGRVELKIQGVGAGKADILAEDTVRRTIDANESGSTLRFLIPIASLFGGETQFVGRGKLGSRPLDIYEEIYAEQALTFDHSGQDPLDLRVAGRLSPGTYRLAGNVSSQFITGLLYTLPLLEGDSVIEITTELESVGYLDLTLEILERFGISVTYDEAANAFRIPGKQVFQARNYRVEGDFSQAAFFLVAGALGNEVTVAGLDPDSKQGDREIIDILQNLGAVIEVNERGLRAQAGENGLLGGIEIDGSQCPDIIPVTALAAALASGKTVISNLARLRIKESDRLQATAEELTKLGAKIQVVGDALHIEGVPQLKGEAVVWSHKDHRMAMMLGIAGTVCEEVFFLKDSECVAKSYPNFWEDYENLGGRLNERRLG